MSDVFLLVCYISHASSVHIDSLTFQYCKVNYLDVVGFFFVRLHF
jgi:hypothetical protein